MLHFATKLAPEPAPLDLARSAGFQCSEFWMNGDRLLDIRPILDAIRGRGMRHVIHFPNSGPLGEEQLSNAVRLYRAIGSDAMVIHTPMLRSYGPRLLELDPGVKLCVENGIEAGADFSDWAERNEWLTLDVEHVWKFALRDAPLDQLLDTVREILATHGSRIRHVHLPGYSPGAPEHRPAHYSPDLVLPVFDLLQDIGFGGLIVSELDHEFQTLDHLRKDVALFRAWSNREPHPAGKIAAPFAAATP